MNGRRSMTGATVRRAVAAVLLTLLTLSLIAPPANAHPQSRQRTERLLAEFWQALLSKTNAEARPTICLRYGHRALTPFILGNLDPKSPQVTEIECDARAGETLVMTGYTAEQSASEEGPDWTPEKLRAKAVEFLGSPPTATYNGRPLPLRLVVTKLTQAHLPHSDNLFGNTDRGETVFVAAAWVTTIRLRPGSHTVLITATNGVVYTTTLHVRC